MPVAPTDIQWPPYVHAWFHLMRLLQNSHKKTDVGLCPEMKQVESTPHGGENAQTQTLMRNILYDVCHIYKVHNLSIMSVILWYGDSAGNTVENSSVFSVIQMR